MSRRKPTAEQAREQLAAYVRMLRAANRDPAVRAARVACDRAAFSPEYRLGRIAIGDGS